MRQRTTTGRPRLESIDPEQVAPSKQEAKRCGLRFYQGKACRAGHGGIRYASNNSCVECQRSPEHRARVREGKRKRARSRKAQRGVEVANPPRSNEREGPFTDPLTEKESAVVYACIVYAVRTRFRARQRLPKIGHLAHELAALHAYDGKPIPSERACRVLVTDPFNAHPYDREGSAQ